MATLLTKDIKRETYSVFDRKGNKIIVTLKAGDMLEFRAKGYKTRFEVPIAACRNLALIYYMEERYKNKLQRYKERKKLGLRCKKPKRPPQVFSKKWYQALSKR